MANVSELTHAALAHYQAGQFEQAIRCNQRALELDPFNVVALTNLSAVLQRLGRLDEAIEPLRRALSLCPGDLKLLTNLGMALRAQGHLEEALDVCTQAVAAHPNSSRVHIDLGLVLQKQGKLDQAINCFRRAIELDPQAYRAYHNWGAALMAAGDSNGAIDCYRRAIAIRPTLTVTICNLGTALVEQCKFAEAVTAFRAALQLEPNNAEILNSLGAALQQNDQLQEAAACYCRALEIDPGLAKAHTNLGTIFRCQRRLDDAEKAHRRAISLDPAFAEAWNHLGMLLKDQAKLDEAVACFRKAITIQPGFASAHSNLLYILPFCERYDAAAIYEENRRFNDQHARPLAKFIQHHTNDRSPDRRLRIGYVSSNFHTHATSFFTVPLLASHDHEQFEIFCYVDVRYPDSVTNRLRSVADHWRNITGLSPRQTAECVRDDNIDILVDLTMHMNNNRILTFALKPAPVQVCWVAYPGTTGLTTIDYRLTDPFLDPPGELDPFYSEKSYRLPDTFWCYDSQTSDPQVNRLPALQNGYVTFGSLNNFCKNNDTTWKRWAQVLKTVDRSQLTVLADEGPHREHALHVLEKEGIGRERVSFVGPRPRLEYLRLYQSIDIGLDTLPSNGHTTSFDAYWMGVPVVTLVGKTPVGRAGLSQLTNLGLTELIANTPEEYVSIAANLATDMERLSQLRQSLRDRLQASPLMNADRFARGIEQGYRTMWQRWCEAQANPKDGTPTHNVGAPAPTT
jgi:predicted O-linked N-acetylglucosamine transferase (SPINDLY family)